MTREEYVAICKGCLKREFNPKQGIICSLTKEKASFEENCVEFAEDSKSKQQEIANQLHIERDAAEEKDGTKNMIYGALWCVGGIIGTVSDTGYIFWGAILFGGIQFIQGAMASSKN